MNPLPDARLRVKELLRPIARDIVAAKTREEKLRIRSEALPKARAKLATEGFERSLGSLNSSLTMIATNLAGLAARRGSGQSKNQIAREVPKTPKLPATQDEIQAKVPRIDEFNSSSNTQTTGSPNYNRSSPSYSGATVARHNPNTSSTLLQRQQTAEEYGARVYELHPLPDDIPYRAASIQREEPEYNHGNLRQRIIEEGKYSIEKKEVELRGLQLDNQITQERRKQTVENHPETTDQVEKPRKQKGNLLKLFLSYPALWYPNLTIEQMSDFGNYLMSLQPAYDASGF